MPDSNKYRIDIHPVAQFIPDQSDPDENRYLFAYTIVTENTPTSVGVSNRAITIDDATAISRLAYRSRNE